MSCGPIYVLEVYQCTTSQCALCLPMYPHLFVLVSSTEPEMTATNCRARLYFFDFWFLGDVRFARALWHKDCMFQSLNKSSIRFVLCHWAQVMFVSSNCCIFYFNSMLAMLRGGYVVMGLISNRGPESLCTTDVHRHLLASVWFLQTFPHWFTPLSVDLAVAIVPQS